MTTMKEQVKLIPQKIHARLWQQYLQKFPKKAYRQGESILLEGESPEHLHIIASGYVRVYNITQDGEEHTVSFDVPGEIFPIAWAFKEVPHTEYFYQALTDCEVRLIKRDDFLRYLKFHPKTALELYANTARRYGHLQKRIYALEQSKASHKILFTLDYLENKFGTKLREHTSIIDIPLTQQELANFIGITRETTSTELKKLERAGIVTSKKQRFHINTPKLQSAIEAI